MDNLQQVRLRLYQAGSLAASALQTILGDLYQSHALPAKGSLLQAVQILKEAIESLEKAVGLL